MRKFTSHLLMFIIWGAVIFSLNKKWGQLPPLGSLLNPFHGAWQNGINKKVKSKKFQELSSEVQVTYDSYGIPHVFAKEDGDLYFLQGYLHAQDRLFQMDLATRAGSGRLSELFGDRTEELDLFFVSLGVREAARRSLEHMLADPASRLAIESYVAGVNHYISNLSKKDFPIEYKLLNTKPELFTSLHVAQFLKMKAIRLASKSFDLEMNRLFHLYGEEKTFHLFPHFISKPEPIFSGKNINKFKSELFINQPNQFENYDDKLLNFISLKNEPEGFNGSNNWAISKSKSSLDAIVVANDTHLGLTLPNVWYEMQLNKKGDRNVYGVSFPGAPGIIIGFNENISWAVTNATLDAMDFYQFQFRNNFGEYSHLGEWKKSIKTIETIKIRDKTDKELALIWTEFGVVIDKKMSPNEFGLVLNWTALEGGNELLAFLKLNSAKSHAECLETLKLFKAPAQNFICADKKDYSITHNGKIYKKRVGEGRIVMDGTHVQWPKEEVPFEELPSSKNPIEGFVFSANQSAVKEDYKHYLGWFYDDPYRARRIKQFLSSKEKLSLEDMIELQNDIRDEFAVEALPLMLMALQGSSLNDSLQKTIVSELTKWDYKITQDSPMATVFYYWWKNLRNSLWSKKLWTQKSSLVPQDNRTLQFIKEVLEDKANVNLNDFWLGATQEVSSKKILSKISYESFEKAIEDLKLGYGEDWSGWSWQLVNPLTFPHIAFIPGFDGQGVKMGGSLKTVNANKGSHGAAWRMLVVMGDEVKAWSRLPGGVSGNPFSLNYKNEIDPWSNGELKEVLFLKSFDENLDELFTIKFEVGK